MKNVILDEVLYDFPLNKEEIKQIKENEIKAKMIKFKGDALQQLEFLEEDSQVKKTVKKILILITNEIEKEIFETPSSETPSMFFLSGTPGSGKSVLKNKIEKENLNCIYFCGDKIKEKFKELAKKEKIFEKKEQWFNDVFIHRLTSKISWSLIPLAIKLKKNIILEAVGSDAQEDFLLLKKVKEEGYSVSVHHVATSTNKAIESAIFRYFKGEDKGRTISIEEIANLHRKVLESFQILENKIKTFTPEIASFLYDNREWKMDLVFSRTNKKNEENLLDISYFLDFKENKQSLWFKGENHTSDLILFSLVNNDFKVALIKRKKPPFENYWAIPGGFVETSAKKDENYLLDIETPEEAALREFKEETLGEPPKETKFIPVGVYKDISRDPRNSKERTVVSNAFTAFLKEPIDLYPDGNDDASKAEWKSLDDIISGKIRLAFDHYKIIVDSCKKLNIEINSNFEYLEEKIMGKNKKIKIKKIKNFNKEDFSVDKRKKRSKMFR